ncbi:phage holin family protein [Lachnoclostridium phytofermentans]|uniref:phage holin family protein n=1 Tax=Lachnoclostridium phytofermentans TaxID=66219 RepID=UPI0004979692|nr:phage holin family protein [Lachnoclostridium phytofermentans]
MEKYFNKISIVIAAIGGWLAGAMGGWDMLLKTIVALVILDYLTGFIKGIYTKSLSSEIGFKGLLKKVMIFIVIAAAYQMQLLLGESIKLREIVIMFFICNEGLSLVENAAVLIPMPARLKDTLLQLRDKTSGEDGGDNGKE